MYFFFNDTATTEIYTLSLHDALPISDRRDRGRPARRLLAGGFRRQRVHVRRRSVQGLARRRPSQRAGGRQDRKSTRLNSSHQIISYSVFFFKKKKLSHHHILHSFEND